jgi:hypothetical protein
MSTLQHDELLTQSEILEEETLPSAKEADQPGVALVTTAGFLLVFVLPVQFRGHTNKPYIGRNLIKN